MSVPAGAGWASSGPDIGPAPLFDFAKVFAYVRFTAHSVIELGDGGLVDITPPPAINPNAGIYPFLRAELPEQSFQDASDALIIAHGAAHLDHVYR